MTNQEDRIGKLDDLFDQACKKLADWMDDSSDIDSVDPQTSFGIIDRWLQVRREDREYELLSPTRFPCKMTFITGLDSVSRCVLDLGHQGDHITTSEAESQ